MLVKGKQTCHTRASTIHSLNNMRHQDNHSDICRTTISECAKLFSYPGAEVTYYVT